MHAPNPAIIAPEMLLLAYRSGIFPMADSRDDPEIFWVEPRERAIIPLDRFHCSQSLRKIVRQGRYHVTLNADFAGVIHACSQPRPDHPESWISERIEASYRQLHAAGHAHSVECWAMTDRGNELVGGLYGVSFDRVFCGESMFSRADNASKVALTWLVAIMRHAGFQVLDCQFMTGHLASMGAVEIPQAEYLNLIGAARGEPAMTLPDAYCALTASAAGTAATGAAGCGSGAAGDAARAGAGAGSAGGVSPAKLILQSLTQTS